jgi:hypothetical protein
MSYDQIRDVIGRPDCFPVHVTFGAYEYGYAFCDWDEGIDASFFDDDLDGRADADGLPFSLDLHPPYAGTTDEGYGVGSELACFLQRATPSGLFFAVEETGWEAQRLSFDGYVVWEHAGLGETADGLADQISLDAD